MSSGIVIVFNYCDLSLRRNPHLSWHIWYTYCICRVSLDHSFIKSGLWRLKSSKTLPPDSR